MCRRREDFGAAVFDPAGALGGAACAIWSTGTGLNEIDEV